jgi:hypothetical protein
MPSPKILRSLSEDYYVYVNKLGGQMSNGIIYISSEDYVKKNKTSNFCSHLTESQKLPPKFQLHQWLHYQSGLQL